MFDLIRHWWYTLRTKWSLWRMGRAWGEQARVLGEALIPAIQEAIEATDAFARACEAADFQGRNWNRQFESKG